MCIIPLILRERRKPIADRARSLLGSTAPVSAFLPPTGYWTRAKAARVEQGRHRVGYLNTISAPRYSLCRRSRTTVGRTSSQTTSAGCKSPPHPDAGRCQPRQRCRPDSTPCDGDHRGPLPRELRDECSVRAPLGRWGDDSFSSQQIASIGNY